MLFRGLCLAGSPQVKHSQTPKYATNESCPGEGVSALLQYSTSQLSTFHCIGKSVMFCPISNLSQSIFAYPLFQLWRRLLLLCLSDKWGHRTVLDAG